jgi:hypothetical protein
VQKLIKTYQACTNSVTSCRSFIIYICFQDRHVRWYISQPRSPARAELVPSSLTSTNRCLAQIDNNLLRGGLIECCHFSAFHTHKTPLDSLEMPIAKQIMSKVTVTYVTRYFKTKVARGDECTIFVRCRGCATPKGDPYPSATYE